ncbi:Cas9 inhibitor AcrIIA9 family protein [Solobacterium moorei]|uniref:Cas9 inhibitor AcrIIA9 family protein n=1 Tax=Solobacterium moorei TaxID=102148 RepID=UPI000423275A|nr:Cas9 inhibitor AcrIIA9 family protein [Solobacterium moorei]BET21283.1 Cas9 inhibitor AcrIIA9 family protein [Solobacterium moorei]
MSEIKQRALEKMNEEMNQKHSRSIDPIHNWLCEQEDDDLFEKICQDGKTIKAALEYCANNAYKSKENNCAMIADSVVFGWVVDYFNSDLKEVKSSVTASVTTSNDKKPVAKKQSPKIDVKTNHKKAYFERINLFEL